MVAIWSLIYLGSPDFRAAFSIWRYYEKIIKSIPVYLTVVMIFCCSLVVPAFASSSEAIPFQTFGDDSIYTADGMIPYSGGWYGVWSLPAGKYFIDYTTFPDIVDHVFWHNGANNKYIPVPVNDGIIEITADMLWPYTDPEFLANKCELFVNSNGGALIYEFVDDSVEDVPVVDNNVGVYYQAFDMFAGFIYGEDVELTAEQNMVLTILATTAALFVVVVPFLILFFVLRLFR